MRILIVKLSSLGDVIHALPILVDIKNQYPDVQLDWVVEPSFASLLEFNPNIDRVISCSLRDWVKEGFGFRTLAKVKSFLKDLRQTPYDYVLDLQGLSKSALIARCAALTPQGVRVAMGNRTDGSSYESLTRWLSDRAIALPKRIHALERGRLLCAKTLHYEVPSEIDFGLLGAGKENVSSSAFEPEVAQSSSDQPPKVLLIHGTSRTDKTWGLSHWSEIAERLKASGHEVCVTYGNEAELEFVNELMAKVKGLTFWPKQSLRDLSTLMRGCYGAIGVDSGVSHLAVALNLVHVQIYNFPTDWRTGPLHCSYQLSVHAHPSPGVDLVWQKWLLAVDEWQSKHV